jgi:DNA modification methylase
MNTIKFGDCRDLMRQWAAEGVKVQTCVTSPPYFGLRDYGHEEQIGLEQTPEEYIKAMVEVFRCVWDVLDDDGTLWLNIGDSYARQAGDDVTRGTPATGHRRVMEAGADRSGKGNNKPPAGYKAKDLIGVPWMLAFALRADGWYLRQDIIWHKPNPMPESVRDRCTKAHEYIFLLSKSQKYFFDSEAMKEPAKYGDHHAKYSGTYTRHKVEAMQIEGATNGENYQRGMQQAMKDPLRRNRRSVWTVTTKPYKGAHFATFPPDLIEPCVLAGSKPGDIVLDPFMGSGTTAQVALQHGRQYLGCELNPEYGPLQEKRIADARERNRAVPGVARRDEERAGVQVQEPVTARGGRPFDLFA